LRRGGWTVAANLGPDPAVVTGVASDDDVVLGRGNATRDDGALRLDGWAVIVTAPHHNAFW
jgi:hypothetical protein